MIRSKFQQICSPGNVSGRTQSWKWKECGEACRARQWISVVNGHLCLTRVPAMAARAFQSDHTPLVAITVHHRSAARKRKTQRRLRWVAQLTDLC